MQATSKEFCVLVSSVDLAKTIGLPASEQMKISGSDWDCLGLLIQKATEAQNVTLDGGPGKRRSGSRLIQICA